MINIRECLNNPWALFPHIAARFGYFERMDDELYLKWMFRARMGYKLNLKDPKTFNEKLQWLKLHDCRPEYTMMVDKYLVREYIAKKLGEEYLIPLIGVWDDPDEINFDALPDQFVLKCNHNSGRGLCICRDKSKLDVGGVKRRLRQGLAQNYYFSGREWPYKDVPRKIICEQYMTDRGDTLKDYKFFCFGGSVKCFKVDFDRFIEHHANYYDPESHILNFGEEICPPKFEQDIHMPKTINKMQELAEQLSESIPFLRTDFYDVDGKIYFGECTFYPASGMGKFIPEEWDRILGKWLTLPSGGGNARHR